MNAESIGHSRHQTQIEEVKESLNRLTLNFKSRELQQQYEQAIYKQKAGQLLKIYFVLAVVAIVGVVQQAIQLSDKSDEFFLIILISLSSTFILISCLLRYLPKFSRIWNVLGIFSINISILLVYLSNRDHESQDQLSEYGLLCSVICFILQRYNNNFALILLSLITTFATISLLLSYSFYGFMVIALIIALYNLYQSEYLQKQAFWFERFNYQQNHIIENVVTSSLFYIRYNKKEERLEFQRGNKRFCDKFDVKDDETMRYFLKNTKISHKSEEQQTINSLWNSVNSTWKSSLDGLIHKKIKELQIKIQAQHNLNQLNNQLKEITNSLLKEKSQNNTPLPQISQQQQLSNNQTNPPQPLSIIESNGQSGYLSHKSSSPQKKVSPPIKGKRLPQMSSYQNESNLNEIEKDKQFLSREELDNNLIPSSQYMSRQNIFSPPNQSKKNFLLSDDQASVSKKAIGDDDYEKEREEIREQIRQVNPKPNKLKRLNSGLQNQTQPSPQLGLQRTFTWRNNSHEAQVYKAKYTNQAGEKIKFLVRIMIFQMNDTYLAVSIEKEEKNKKYKQLKSKLSFFESVFTQLMNECNKKSAQELNTLRKLIPLSMQVEQQLQQLNQAQQNIANQLSSQLLSLNIEYPRRHSIERYLQKQLIRDTSLSVNQTVNTNGKEQGSNKSIRQKGLTATTALNTTCITLNQQGITLNQDITLNQEGITLNQQGIQATSTTTTTTTAYTTTTTTVPIPNSIGVLKKPSPSMSPNQQLLLKNAGISNLQDIPQRDSFQAVLPSATTTTTTTTKIEQSEGSKASSPTEKMDQTQFIQGYTNLSQIHLSNQNGLQQVHMNQNNLTPKQIPIQVQQNISQNCIQFINNSQKQQQKIQKGQLQSNLNNMLYLTYNGRYTIMNYNYFFEFFKKRTHLEIFTSMSLTALVDSVVQMFKQELKQKKIKIFTDYFDKELRINTDQNALRQIIFNLLQNALQYTPNNGYIALKTEQDSKYTDCVKLKIRNSYYQSNSEKMYTPLPESEDCKLKIEDMISYFKRKGRVNLGLRVAQRLIKIIGPTDKIILKGDKPDHFQVEFSLYNNLHIVQKGSYSQLPSQKALHTSYAISQDKTNNNSEKGLNGSNNLHAFQTEAQISEQPKKNLLGLYQSAFKQSQNPFSNQMPDKMLNSDQSFDSFVEQVFNKSDQEDHDIERKSLSADRFKHLN